MNKKHISTQKLGNSAKSKTALASEKKGRGKMGYCLGELECGQ